MVSEIACVAGTAEKRKAWMPLVVQLGAFVLILGVPDGSIGVLWPSMRATFHLPLDDLGLLTVAGTLLYITGGLAGNSVRSRAGVGGSMIGCCALAAVMLAAWAGAPDWGLVLLAFALLGLARGVVDAVLNADAALDGGVRRLGLLHGSWAVGGTMGPLLVAAVLAGTHDWRLAVAITAGAVACLTPVAIAEWRLAKRDAPVIDGDSEQALATSPTRATRPPATDPGLHPPDPAIHPTDPAIHPTEPAIHLTDPAIHLTDPGIHLRNRLPLVLTILAFIAYTGAESGPIAWGYTYLISDRGVSRTLAALAMAAFWAALTCGRFGLAAVDDRIPPAAILEGSCVLLAVGTGMFWLLPGALAVLGLPVAGLGSAAVFPMLVALTPERIGESGTGQAVGASVAAAGLGGPAAVALFGVIAAHLGVRVLGVCLFAAAVLMYLVNRVLTTVSARLAT